MQNFDFSLKSFTDSKDICVMNCCFSLMGVDLLLLLSRSHPKTLNENEAFFKSVNSFINVLYCTTCISVLEFTFPL